MAIAFSYQKIPSSPPIWMADKWGAQLASLDNCGRQKSISLRTLSVHLHLLLLTTVLYLWLCLWVTAFSCWLIFRLWNLVCVFTDWSSKFEYSKLGSRVSKNCGVRISFFWICPRFGWDDEDEPIYSQPLIDSCHCCFILVMTVYV